MAAYADAFLGEGSPLAADAVTVSPYLGFGALAPVLQQARATGRGAFVLALTSNPEGAPGPARGHATAAGASRRACWTPSGRRTWPTGPCPVPGRAPSVSSSAPRSATSRPWRPGSTSPARSWRPASGRRAASAADLRAVFGAALPHVLPTVSRQILRAGVGVADAGDRRRALRAAFDAELTGVRAAIGGRWRRCLTRFVPPALPRTAPVSVGSSLAAGAPWTRPYHLTCSIVPDLARFRAPHRPR